MLNKNVLDLNIADLELSSGYPELSSDGASFKIVANLPYNITSVFLRKFLDGARQRGRDSERSREARTRVREEERVRASDFIGVTASGRGFSPSAMTLMLQKEVAERIVASPPKMSLLAVSVQYFADAKIISYVNKENFWPIPKVDSVIVKINIKNIETSPGSSRANEKDFFRLVKIGFSARRKMLKNNLAAGYQIDQKEVNNLLKTAGFSKKVRAQELSVKDWQKLFGKFKGIML